MNMLSLIHRLNLSLSCSTIWLASQFTIWLFWQTWSVMPDLWCSLVEALRVDLVKFLSEIFSTSFCVLWSWFPAVSLFHRYIPFRIGCMEFCTPLEPFFAYQLCPSGELKPIWGWFEWLPYVLWIYVVFSPWMSGHMGQSPLLLIFLVLYLSWIYLFCIYIWLDLCIYIFDWIMTRIYIFWLDLWKHGFSECQRVLC